MRNVFKSVFLICLVTWAASVSAQTTSFPVFNFPPCDFSDNFYTINGFDASKPTPPEIGPVAKTSRIPCPS